MKKMTFLVTMLVFFGLVCEGWAEFYVIAAGKRAKRTVLVSPKNTPTVNGTELLNAIYRITDATASNPYLLKIEPGIYDIGSEAFFMKSFVDVEGSGETVTIIRGNINTDTAGVVVGTNNAELRDLTVENTGGGSYCPAIYNDSVSPRITRVTAKADQSSTLSWGIVNHAASPTMTMVTVEAYAPAGGNTRAISNTAGSSPIMNGVTVIASGTAVNIAIHNTGSNTSPQMRNVVATASGGTIANGCSNSGFAAPIMTNCIFTGSGASSYNWGIQTESSATLNLTNTTARGLNGGSAVGLYIYSNGGAVEIKQSLLSGVDYSIRNDSASAVQIGTSQLKGTVSGTLGTFGCVYCYDESYGELDNACAPVP